MLPTLIGKHGEIELRWGGDAASASAPLIAASEVGFSPLGAASERSRARRSLQAVSRFMRDSPEGAWVALCQHPEERRRFALIQSNRGWTQGRVGFYAARHQREDRVWRDFYYMTTYAALALIDEHWSAEEVVLSHPTGHDWPRDLMPAVLDAVGQFADSRPGLSLRRVFMSECCLDGPDEMLDAMKMLNAEQQGPNPPCHRPFAMGPERMKRFGLADGVQLFRVDVPNRLDRRDAPPACS